MACQRCISEAVKLQWPAQTLAQLRAEAMSQVRSAQAQLLLEKHGPDVECPGLRLFGGSGPQLAPEGRHSARVCAVCDHVFCPRIEPPEPAKPKGDSPAQARGPEPTAGRDETAEPLRGHLMLQVPNPGDGFSAAPGGMRYMLTLPELLASGKTPQQAVEQWMLARNGRFDVRARGVEELPEQLEGTPQFRARVWAVTMHTSFHVFTITVPGQHAFWLGVEEACRQIDRCMVESGVAVESAEPAKPKRDPRDLFGLLSPQDLGDDDE